jgi:hypothetical protein
MREGRRRYAIVMTRERRLELVLSISERGARGLAEVLVEISRVAGGGWRVAGGRWLVAGGGRRERERESELRPRERAYVRL